jgi:AraC family transcriptional activator of tynA and feaB
LRGGSRLHLGRRIDGGLGWGLALSAYVRQLSTPIDALPASLVADQLGSLLTLALDRERVDKPMRQDLGACIDEALAARCTEPDLCANGIATTLGVSVRTLHRALASRQQTFADRLMQHRIQRARRMLESPVFDRVTTALVGRRVGFLDASHFVRVCRRVSGLTPQDACLRRC